MQMNDLVLLSPSWVAMQHLLNILAVHASLLDMLCNTRKTMCMAVAPKRKI